MKRLILLLVLFIFSFTIKADDKNIKKEDKLNITTNSLHKPITNLNVKPITNILKPIIITTNISRTVNITNHNNKPFKFPEIKKPTIRTNINPPIILKAPVSQIVTQGHSIKLSTTIKSTTPTKYQWSLNGKNIPQATNSTYSIPNIQLKNQGLYSIAITNNTGFSITPFNLTVKSLTIPPACINSNSIYVTWNYDFTNNPSVNAFKVYYGTNINNYTTNILVKNLTNTVISNLLSGKTYYINAVAVDANKLESIFTSEISYTFPYACNIPFSLNIMMLTNGIPRLTTQVCPNCMLNVYYTTSFTPPIVWNLLGTTLADEFGNIIYDDTQANKTIGINSRFYRMTIQ